MLDGELVVDEPGDPKAGAKGTVCGKSSVFIPVQGALRLKYRGEMEFHRMNIDIYLKNPVGIGEHPDVLGAIDTEVEALAAVTEKLQTLLT